MNLQNKLTIKELINSLQLIKLNPLLLITATIIDAIFFIAWGYFTTPIKDKIVDHSILIANQFTTMMREGKTGLLNRLFDPELLPLTTKFITLLLTLYITMYIVYVIFQGTNWHIAKNIAKQQNKYATDMTGFAKLNILWLMLYITYDLTDTYLKLTTTELGLMKYVLMIVFGIIFLAATLSYPKQKVKTILKTPIKTTIALTTISTSIYLTIEFITSNTAKLNIDIALLLGIILLIPALTLIRVYITRVIIHVDT